SGASGRSAEGAAGEERVGWDQRAKPRSGSSSAGPPSRRVPLWCACARCAILPHTTSATPLPWLSGGLILSGLSKFCSFRRGGRVGGERGRDTTMTMDKSLRVRAGMGRMRSVLTRDERLKKLTEAERWKEGDSPLGLPKVRVYKLAMKKKKKKAAEGE